MSAILETAKTEAAIVKPHRPVGRVIFAATVGNMLEFYDFTIYAAFAVQISACFFPTDSKFVSLLLTFVAYGLGAVIRPIGAVFLGGYADRHGRRSALSLTILLMAFGTGVIAFCPSYQSIGIAAPIIIVLSRLVQGFSVGGEIGGAVTMLTENAPPAHRGFYASFQQSSQGITGILTGLVGIVIAATLTPGEIASWGWRIALAVGLLIAPVGIYIRWALDEAPVFQKIALSRREEAPARVVFRDHWRSVLIGMLLILLWTVTANIIIYFPSFAERELKMSLSNSYLGPIVVGIVVMFSPLAGMLADRFGRKRVMFVGAVGLLVSAYPAFSYLIAEPTATRLIVSQLAIAVALLAYSGPATAVLAELFPTRVRATGIAVTYSLGVALFGAFSPAWITVAIRQTGQPIAVAYYLMGAAVISLLTLFVLKDRTGEELS